MRNTFNAQLFATLGDKMTSPQINPSLSLQITGWRRKFRSIIDGESEEHPFPPLDRV